MHCMTNLTDGKEELGFRNPRNSPSIGRLVLTNNSHLPNDNPFTREKRNHNKTEKLALLPVPAKTQERTCVLLLWWFDVSLT